MTDSVRRSGSTGNSRSETVVHWYPEGFRICRGGSTAWRLSNQFLIKYDQVTEKGLVFGQDDKGYAIFRSQWASRKVINDLFLKSDLPLDQLFEKQLKGSKLEDAGLTGQHIAIMAGVLVDTSKARFKDLKYIEQKQILDIFADLNPVKAGKVDKILRHHKDQGAARDESKEGHLELAYSKMMAEGKETQEADKRPLQRVKSECNAEAAL